jgi:hypothetical protein
MFFQQEAGPYRSGNLAEVRGGRDSLRNSCSGPGYPDFQFFGRRGSLRKVGPPSGKVEKDLYFEE